MRKKIYTIFTAIALVFALSAAKAQVIVYFTVDMSTAMLGAAGGTCPVIPFDPSFDVVEPMGGEYNGWSSPENVACGLPFTPNPDVDMVPVSPGSLIYTITAPALVPDGNGFCNFKYRIDHSWDNDEIRGVGDGNRHAKIPAGATSVLIASVFNDSTNVITNVSGISNPTFAQIQKVYPNPASDISRVAFNVLQPGDVQVYVSDATGKKVLTLVDEKLAFGPYEKSVNVSGLAPGMYLVTVQIGSSSVTQKLSVVR
ncbi:MAG: T9SS type A sorting domain-containing protein [Chitinophagales bacterium]|nr:T9SS type A sorting domain-containing protein [Chitinophagales bacterium]